MSKMNYIETSWSNDMKFTMKKVTYLANIAKTIKKQLGPEICSNILFLSLTVILLQTCMEKGHISQAIPGR